MVCAPVKWTSGAALWGGPAGARFADGDPTA